MIFLRFLTLVLGVSLLSSVVAVEKIASQSPNNSGLWTMMQTYADAPSSSFLSMHNQETRRIIDLPVKDFGASIGWSRDGQWLLYTDSRECDHAGCFPEGDLMRIHLTGRDNTQIGHIGLGDASLLRSNRGRWYAHLNQDYELFLYREDGRDTRHLTQLHGDRAYYARMRWSPDDEWLYIGLGFTVHDEDEPILEIVRIRPDSTVLEPVIRLNQFYGENMVILEDTILFTASDVVNEHTWLYQSNLDGSDLEQLFEIESTYARWNFLAAPSGTIFAYNPYGENDLIEFDPETGQPHTVLQNSHDEPLYLANPQPPVSSLSQNHLQRSPSGRYFTGKFMDPFRDEYWVVLSEEGDIIFNYWHEDGMLGNAFWVDDVAYIIRTTNDEVYTELLAYKEGDRDYTVLRDFPENAYNVVSLNTYQHHWFWYRLRDTPYVTNLDGTATYPMSPNINNYASYGWVEVPFQQRNHQWLIVLGIACFGVTLIATRLIRRR